MIHCANLWKNATPARLTHSKHKFCNTFEAATAQRPRSSPHNERCFCDELWGIVLIEVFVRLGLALMLSLGLALLLAWGWDSSDRTQSNTAQQRTESPAQPHAAQ